MDSLDRSSLMSRKSELSLEYFIYVFVFEFLAFSSANLLTRNLSAFNFYMMSIYIYSVKSSTLPSGDVNKSHLPVTAVDSFFNSPCN